MKALRQTNVAPTDAEYSALRRSKTQQVEALQPYVLHRFNKFHERDRNSYRSTCEPRQFVAILGIHVL
jgi:hypothetical protein